MLPLLAALLLQVPATPPPAPVSAQAEKPAVTAESLWERICTASGPAERPPLTAFQLQADVRMRKDMQRNDAHIDYRYLAPDCIRFMLPSKRETGRFGPAQEQYWLRDGKEVIQLAGRDYKEDRRAVDDMLALARNYVALSNPARLQLKKLELIAPPADLGEERVKRLRKLTWLAIESPDFALVRSDVAQPEGTVYRVELGVGENALPVCAIVRALPPAKAEPLLVEFSQYQNCADFHLPFQLLVFVLEPRQDAPVFASSASQEVYVTEAALRPPLTVKDFQP